MKPTNIYLTEEQHRLLKKEKERTGAPVAEIIRRAINKHLEIEKK
jgi:predicted DNA-binding protein